MVLKDIIYPCEIIIIVFILIRVWLNSLDEVHREVDKAGVHIIMSFQQKLACIWNHCYPSYFASSIRIIETFEVWNCILDKVKSWQAPVIVDHLSPRIFDLTYKNHSHELSRILSCRKYEFEQIINLLNKTSKNLIFGAIYSANVILLYEVESSWTLL